MSMIQCLLMVLKDLPNFILSLIIISLLVIATSYTQILANGAKRAKIKDIYNISYNKLVGYIILLTVLNLSHVVIGGFELSGIEIGFIQLDPRSEFYNIYITVFIILFFKECILLLKNINKFGIDLNAFIKLADKLDKKIDSSVENYLDKEAVDEEKKST